MLETSVYPLLVEGSEEVVVNTGPGGVNTGPGGVNTGPGVKTVTFAKICV